MLADLALHAMDAHQHLSVLAAAHPHVSVLADGSIPVPNPPAQQLPGPVGDKMNQILGWGKTLIGFAGVAGCLIAGGGMMLGIRGRSQLAKDHMTHLAWILGGGAVASMGAFLV